MVPDSRPSARFCAECGTALPPGAKFCPHCGSPVGDPPADAAPQPPDSTIPPELREKYERAREELRGDRREVVVLFADLSGFTSMSERMDAEDVGFVMQGLLSGLADVVYRYEGYVDKYIGDAVMALFGAPIAHENDAERAVLAALDMLEVTARKSAAATDRLAIRVGLNLGEVVAARVGSDSRHQYTVMGDTVNVASRLEGAAEPGSVLVSESVHERTGTLFEFEAVPPLALKGKAESLRAFRVVRYRKARSRNQSAVPFVGRETELGVVQTFLKTAARRPAGVLLIQAEAGAGKTRLVSEALQGDEDTMEVVEVDFSQIDHPGRLPIVPELFRAIASAKDELPSTASALIESVFEWVDESTFGNHLSGVESLARQLVPDEVTSIDDDEDPGIVRQNRWLTITTLLHARSKKSPLLLRLEDVHWATDADEEFLRFLVSRIDDEPVSIIATSRMDAELDWPPGDTQRLELPGLGEQAARQILGQLFENLRPRQRAELIRRSQGNPFYLEQLARSLRDAVDDVAVSVPGTIQGLLQSRIDGLQQSVRLLLQMASVLGASFPSELLARMYRLEHQPVPFESALSRLQEEGFIDVDADREDARFHHALMLEVSYGSLLLRMRKILHESAARLGEEYFSDRSDNEFSFFAHHYWEAGLFTEAAPHLWAAGRVAVRNHELHTAERFLERLADVASKHPEVVDEPQHRADFMHTLGTVLKERGRFQEADEWFEQLQSLGEHERNTSWTCRALFSRGAIALFQGRIDRAQTLFESGLASSQSEGRIAADLHSGLGMVHYFRDDVDGALQQHGQALQLREAARDRFGYVKSLMNLGNVHFHLLDDPPAARERYEQALEIARKNGDREIQGSLVLNLGTLDLEAGEYQSALNRFYDMQELAEEVGLSRLRFLSLRNQAVCDVRLGRIDSAIRALRTCLREGDEVLDPSNRVAVRLLFFEAHFSALDDDGAARWLRDAGGTADQCNVEGQDDWLRLCEARVVATAGDWSETISAYAKTIEVAERLHEPNTARIAHAQLWRARANRGDDDLPPFPVATDPRPSMAALLGYLEADGRAATGERDRAINELGAAGALAERAGDLTVARAAYQRQAELFGERGDVMEGDVARERALRAIESFKNNLPQELLAAFDAHPRNGIMSE